MTTAQIIIAVAVPLGVGLFALIDVRRRRQLTAMSEQLDETSSELAACRQRADRGWTVAEIACVDLRAIVDDYVATVNGEPTHPRPPMPAEGMAPTEMVLAEQVERARRHLTASARAVASRDQLVDEIDEVRRENRALDYGLRQTLTFLQKWDEWATTAASRLPNGGAAPTLRRRRTDLVKEIAELRTALDTQSIPRPLPPDVTPCPDCSGNDAPRGVFLELTEGEHVAIPCRTCSATGFAHPADTPIGRQRQIDVADGLPRCRVCGCTPNAACGPAADERVEHGDDDACYWAEPDLCSRCTWRVAAVTETLVVDLDPTARTEYELRDASGKVIGRYFLPPTMTAEERTEFVAAGFPPDADLARHELVPVRTSGQGFPLSTFTASKLDDAGRAVGPKFESGVEVAPDGSTAYLPGGIVLRGVVIGES